MDTRHLQCFKAVAENLNFTKAAYQLCLTPSAVSRQIAALEEELGVRLFDRAPNAVRFTAEGAHFQAGLGGVLNAYEALVASTRSLRTGRAMSLEIGFLGGVEKRLLPRLVRRLRERHPGLALRMDRFDLVPLSLALARGEVDVAFTLGLSLPEASGLRSRLLFRERLVVLMSPEHPLAGRTALRFEDLRGETFLDLEHPLNAPANDLLVDICTRRGFRPRIGQRYHNLDSLVMAIESGVGIGVFPKYRGDENKGERLTYVALEGPECTTDYVVAWRLEHGNPVLGDFLRELGIRA
nr:LysR family transcriptional regulator [uncultured Holophaga sp.]